MSVLTKLFLLSILFKRCIAYSSLRRRKSYSNLHSSHTEIMDVDEDSYKELGIKPQKIGTHAYACVINDLILYTD